MCKICTQEDVMVFNKEKNGNKHVTGDMESLSRTRRTSELTVGDMEYIIHI